MRKKMTANQKYTHYFLSACSLLFVASNVQAEQTSDAILSAGFEKATIEECKQEHWIHIQICFKAFHPRKELDVLNRCLDAADSAYRICLAEARRTVGAFED